MSARYVKAGGVLVPLANGLVTAPMLVMNAPAQGFVNAWLGMLNGFSANAYVLPGLTSMNGYGAAVIAGFAAVHAAFLDDAPMTFDFSDSALDTASVDSFLSGLLGNLVYFGNTFGGTLDLSGANAAPTPAQVRVNGTWTIEITGTPDGTIELADADSNVAAVEFGVDVDVTSGDPATIAGLLAAYINGLAYAGWNAVVVGAVVTVTVTADVSLPLVPGTDNATNLTIANVAGQPFIPNANIGDLVSTQNFTVINN